MSATVTIEPMAPSAKESRIERRVDVAGTSVRYVEGGIPNPGPPLMLIHGFQAGADIWFPYTFPALAAERHVIALDLPGFAYSGPLQIYTAESYAHFMHAFLDALDFDIVDLLGHSMGGQIAVATAAERPARFRRLVLVASAGLPRTGSGRVVTPLILLDRGTYHFRLYFTFLRLAFRARAGRQCLRMLRDDSIHGHLSGLAMPTLIIWGARDRVVPLEYATIFARTIPKARLYIIRRCGHLPFYQKHLQFEKLVLSFLAK